MIIEFLLQAMRRHAGEEAVVTGDRVCTHGDLLELVAEWQGRLQGEKIGPGTVASMNGDYDPRSIALFLALARNRDVIVPLSRDSGAHHRESLETAQVEATIDPFADPPAIHFTGRGARHELYTALRRRKTAGLVLFSSGSTGKRKAVVHDLAPLLAKFREPRNRWRTLIFLQLDHIGGVNTLLYTLANGGTVVVPEDRSPGAVCRAIERHGVELLPTSPTFLNLLLLWGAHARHDLSSLKLITYGTEPMPRSTLDRAAEAFPNAALQQTYGLSELGILRSKSRESRSLWVRLGGEGYETKIVDGRLWVKSRSAMLGYLNAPSPFDEEGYFDTGDMVEVDGDWLRILGRRSEIINVGGYKVFPAEVENTLLQMDNVEDVAVHGHPNALTGKVVAATVRLRTDEPANEFKARLRRFCRGRLQPYEIPMKIRLTSDPLHSERFKRLRPGAEVTAQGEET